MTNKYDETNAIDYENGFYLTSSVLRLGNIMAHYELYKRIINIPGDIVELGRGGGVKEIDQGFCGVCHKRARRRRSCVGSD